MTAARNVAPADTTTARSSGRSDVFAGQGMRSMRLKSMRPQTPHRNAGGADTSAATRGVRYWRQDGERQPAKHHSSLASQASLSGRKESSSSVPGRRAVARLHARMAVALRPFCQKRRCSFRSSVLSPLYRFLGRFFSSSCSAAEHKASLCVQAHIPQSTARLPRLLRTE